MEVASLTVEKREAKGTNMVRQLRDTGRIPVNLYGGPEGAVSLQANYAEIKRHLEHHLRVYNLELGGKKQPGFLKDVQWDCLTDEPLHVDFLRIDMNVPLKMEVEFTLLGRPAGETRGGILVRDVKNLKLACLPAHVPEQIELRIDALDGGEKVYARDLELPEGCSLDMPEDKVLLHMTEIDERTEVEETTEE